MELQDVFDVAQHAQLELKTYFHGLDDILEQCLCARDRPINFRLAIDTPKHKSIESQQYK